MALPELTVVALEGDVPGLLARLPTRAGVAQVQGPQGQSLLIGRPANLRRWAATHLGAGPPPRKKGQRPPTNLAPIASGVAFAVTSSPFAQRLFYERVMARHVPLSKRRDLKPPFYVHLDPAARFPRLTVRPRADRDVALLFGPFRSRAAAQAAIEAVHREFPLRPCDYTFEPAADLALGLGCVFAQVGSCAAPCLLRMSEEDYRGLAGRASTALGTASERPAGSSDRLPSWVGAIAEARGLVVERPGGILELYPVVRGAVVEEHMARVREEELEAAVAGLSWEGPAEPRDDTPWLLPWLHGTRTGLYLPLRPDESPAAIAGRVRSGDGTSALGVG